MGEYIRYRGSEMKLGTCEDLYYANYPKYIKALKAGLLKQDEGSDKPENYAKPDNDYRFRFPFPDEDEVQLGDTGHGNYNRGLLITINRGDYFLIGQFANLYRKYEVNSATQPELVRNLTMENPNNISDLVDLEITQQKLIQRDGSLRLALIYRCPYSQDQWRVEDYPEAEFMADQIAERYICATDDEHEQDFWRKVNERILQGYDDKLIER